MKKWICALAIAAIALWSSPVAMADSPAVIGNLAQTVLTQNVTGGVASQTVTVANSIPCSAGSLAIVGGLNPEIITIAAAPTTSPFTSVTAVFVNNHVSGDVIQCQFTGAVGGTGGSGSLSSLCPNLLTVSDSTSGQLQQIAAPTGLQRIYICSWSIVAGGSVNFSIQGGTTPNCTVATTNPVQAVPLLAGFDFISPPSGVIVLPAAVAMCFNLTANQPVTGVLFYGIH